ncbi:MAG: hypothetical protein FWB72_02930, partial [Firmicutes bacterium]|nr:hypothetical protein [Bacillota bacterium]
MNFAKSNLILPSGTEVNKQQMQEIVGGVAPAIALGIWGIPKLVAAGKAFFTYKTVTAGAAGVAAAGAGIYLAEQASSASSAGATTSANVTSAAGASTGGGGPDDDVTEDYKALQNLFQD